MPAPSPSLQADVTPPFAREVIALFSDALPKVQFPDLDLALLESAVEELRLAQTALEQAAAALEAAREAAQRKTEQLNARAERALAYARVFAEGNAALSERVANIGRNKARPASEAAQPRKRGRPKKNQHDSSLFGAEPAVGSESTRVSVTTEEAAA